MDMSDPASCGSIPLLNALKTSVPAYNKGDRHIGRDLNPHEQGIANRIDTRIFVGKYEYPEAPGGAPSGLV